MTEDKVNKALSLCPLLSGCRFDYTKLRLIKLKRGDTISDCIDGRRCAAIVASGRIDVFSASRGGEATQLSSLGAGEIFGLSNIFCEGGLETHLVCRTSGSVLLIPKEEIAEQLLQNPQLAERYMTFLNKKISFLLHRIELLTAGTARVKVSDFLLQNVESDSTVTLGCSKERLAKSLCISRAALFRELSALSREGIISVSGGKITICRPMELKLSAGKNEKNEDTEVC